MKKRILSLLTAAAICVSLSACTYSTAEKEEPAENGQETVSAAETEQTADADTQGDQAAAAGTTISTSPRRRRRSPPWRILTSCMGRWR